MRVLHINQSDISGGAAIAAYRLHQGLLAQNIDSRLLVDINKTQSERVVTISRRRTLESLTSRLSSQLGLNYLNIFSSHKITEQKVYQESDLLNLHNLHSGYFNYLALPKLTHHKPAVWTLHDMWSFTGHCAYSFDCDRWKTGCGQCPYPDTYPQIEQDTTHLEWWLKAWVYKRSQLAIVVPSTWLQKLAQSSLLKRFPIHHIPYGIDTEAYFPLDSKQCRAALGIPSQKRVLMFAAASLSDPRKGSDLLHSVLRQLPTSLKKESILLTLGTGEATLGNDLDIQSLSLGYTSSDCFKSIAYSAADLFLFPTRADNLPLTLQESMACGTPMVSFKVGGVPDLVRPGITGYLAEPENVTDFANGVVGLLEAPHLREQMSEQCRAISVAEYSIELQAQRYIEIYNGLYSTKLLPQDR